MNAPDLSISTLSIPHSLTESSLIRSQPRPGVCIGTGGGWMTVEEVVEAAAAASSSPLPLPPLTPKSSLIGP